MYNVLYGSVPGATLQRREVVETTVVPSAAVPPPYSPARNNRVKAAPFARFAPMTVTLVEPVLGILIPINVSESNVNAFVTVPICWVAVNTATIPEAMLIAGDGFVSTDELEAHSVDADNVPPILTPHVE